MTIMEGSLPGLKAFLQPLGLSRVRARLMELWLVAFLLHAGRMAGERAAKAIRTLPRHRAQLTRFLGRKFWSKLDPQRLVIHLLLAIYPLAGEIIFVVDSTLCSRQGTKTPNTHSTGNRKRRPRKGRRYSKYTHAPRRCHSFVMGLLILPCGTRLPFSKSYYTKEYCQQRGLPYRTQTELAAALIRELPRPRKVPMLVVGDTAFDAASIRAACAEVGCHWITPVNPERVLAGSKPRKKIRSLIPDLKAKDFEEVRLVAHQGRYAPHRRVSAWRKGPGKRPRTYYVQGETRDVHSVGKAQLVFSTKTKPQEGRAVDVQKILMSDATDLSPRVIVEAYDVRWQIELFFKELKSGLGFAQCQLRDFNAVEAWVHLTLLAFVYLEWQRRRQLQRKDLTAEERRRWTAMRTHGVREAMRQEAERADLRTIAKLARTPHGLRRLRAALNKAERAA